MEENSVERERVKRYCSLMLNLEKKVSFKEMEKEGLIEK